MGSGYTKGTSLTTTKHWPSFFAGLPSVDNKTLVITGTTSGTGYHTASAFLKKGGKVIGLNRPSERSAKAASEHSQHGPYTAVDCDLQDPKSIDSAIEAIKAITDIVDVICCNAGVMALKDLAAPSGFDVQMQTNHFGHFQLLR